MIFSDKSVCLKVSFLDGHDMYQLDKDAGYSEENWPDNLAGDALHHNHYDNSLFTKDLQYCFEKTAVDGLVSDALQQNLALAAWILSQLASLLVVFEEAAFCFPFGISHLFLIVADAAKNTTHKEKQKNAKNDQVADAIR